MLKTGLQECRGSLERVCAETWSIDQKNRGGEHDYVVMKDIKDENNKNNQSEADVREHKIKTQPSVK